jgi:RNase H-fold protein (predicted Holliday junction resolvase)
VSLVDERLSSASARETLRAAGRGAREHKHETHALAAQVILQAYLDEIKISEAGIGRMERDESR